jgi:hypothetical protein
MTTRVLVSILGMQLQKHSALRISHPEHRRGEMKARMVMHVLSVCMSFRWVALSVGGLDSLGVHISARRQLTHSSLVARPEPCAVYESADTGERYTADIER